MPQQTTNNNFTINIPSVALNAGEKLIFKFGVTNILPDSNFTASINEGSLKVSSLAASTGYSVVTQTSGTGFFHSASMADTTNNTTDIVLSSALSGFWNNNYIFVPNPLTGSISTLYDGDIKYGDVDYPFAPFYPYYDIALVYLNDGTFIESRISKEFKSGSFLHLTLETSLTNPLRSALADQTYTRFLLLSRRPDETNVITTFTKREGKTSYGFLIPENISDNVLLNINTITKEVKQKLINDQSVISDISGGGF